MKRKFEILVVFIGFAWCHVYGQRAYHITGVLGNSAGKKVVLGNKGFGYGPGFIVRHYDSCISRNDTILLSGGFAEKGLYSIEVEGKVGWRTLFIDTGKIIIFGDADSLSKARIIGSHEHDIFNAFLHDYESPLTDRIDEARDSMWARRKVNDSIHAKLYYAEMDSLKAKLRGSVAALIKSHPCNYYSLYALYENVRGYPIAEARSLYNQLCGEIKSTKLGKDIGFRLEYGDSYKQGSKLDQFAQKNPKGKLVDIDQFKGKYVLIDFWASWCVPCVEEFAQLIPLYSYFHKRGFEIIGVSIDQSKTAWKNAVAKYHIPWETTSDLIGSTSPFAVRNGVTAIPRKILIGPDQTIINHDVQTKDLEKILNEIYR